MTANDLFDHKLNDNAHDKNEDDERTEIPEKMRMIRDRTDRRSGLAPPSDSEIRSGTCTGAARKWANPRADASAPVVGIQSFCKLVF